ncbi:MAG: queuosine precursor transporter [Clostridiales bacterium]|jgi:uncharacterized integral membrane protein (TIGR00697 family)|nr:queuosine precursor transporter [Clostridiales bacterium]
MKKKIRPVLTQETFLNYALLAYVVLIVASNVMASKVISVFGFPIDAGTLTYPFTFLIGDVVAELFGYKQSRRVILIGFAANCAFSCMTLMGTLPQAYGAADALANAYDVLFSYNIRILAASFIAYLAGALLNAASLIWIRKLTGRKWLALRTIGSTAIGAFADTAVFTVTAWVFVLSAQDILIMAAISYAVKMIFEIVIATPADYFIVPLIRKHMSDGTRPITRGENRSS